MKVIVHPECRWDVCQKADALGSPERLIKIVEDAPAGSTMARGENEMDVVGHQTLYLGALADHTEGTLI